MVANSSIANSTSGAPGGYPAIYDGCHWGVWTSDSSFPIQVSNSHAGTITASWSTSQPGRSSDYNVAYDTWHASSAQGDQVVQRPDRRFKCATMRGSGSGM
jgi:hypothetical protein